jgi:sugar phosphate isomerase/epimerase
MISRRRFLGTAAGAAACCAFRPQDPYGGFRMGMESWCVRKFDLDRALAAYKELGLSHAEIYPPSHMPVTADPAKLRVYTDKLKAADVAAWGVWTDFGKDEAKNRAGVEFAKALGARVMPGSATPDSFESVARLTKEYGIPFALHNGKQKIDDVVRSLEKWPVAVGACVDTGNFIQAGEDPVRAIRALGARLHAVHLKDSDGKVMSTVMGKGKLDLPGTLRALREVKFAGFLVLEYEQNEDAPMDDLRECLARIREAIARL